METISMSQIQKYQKEIAKILDGKRPRQIKEAVEKYNKEHKTSFMVASPHVPGNSSVFITIDRTIYVCQFFKIFFWHWWQVQASTEAASLGIRKAT